jgi:hypothetical protein
MAGGKPIPVDLPNAVVEGDGLTKQGETMENNYSKDIEDIKVRLAAIEDSMKPKNEKMAEAPVDEAVSADLSSHAAADTATGNGTPALETN